MDCAKMLESLSDKEKLELATRLTQAAMSSFSLEQPNAFEMGNVRDIVDLTYAVFCEMAHIVDTHPEPEVIPPVTAEWKKWRDALSSVSRT